MKHANIKQHFEETDANVALSGLPCICAKTLLFNMDYSFIKCRLPLWVAGNPHRDYHSLTKQFLYRWYMQELDYDAGGDEMDWRKLRIFHRQEGDVCYVLIDYQEKMEGFPVYSLIAYGEGMDAVYFSCSYRFAPEGNSYCLFRHGDDLTSWVIREFRYPISRSKLSRCVMEYLRHPEDE